MMLKLKLKPNQNEGDQNDMRLLIETEVRGTESDASRQRQYIYEEDRQEHT